MAEIDPDSYLPLERLQDWTVGRLITTVGVVVDRLEPRKTKGDWQSTLFLAANRAPDAVQAKVVFFRPDLEDLPAPVAIGNIVALQSIKVYFWNNTKYLLSSHATEWAFFDFGPGDKATVTKSSPDFTPNVSEIEDWIQRIGKPARASGRTDKHQLSVNAAQQAALPPRRDKAALIKQISAPNFYDLTGEVQKIFTAPDGNVDLHITDYTKHKELWDYRPGDPKWRGPVGRMTLRVELLQPHAAWAQENVERGNIVHLRNVRVKYGRQNAMLEGNLWPDGNKILVTVLESRQDPIVMAILARKASYINLCKQNGWTNLTPYVSNLPTKRTNPEAFADMSDADGHTSKKQRTSKSKNKAKTARAAADNAPSNVFAKARAKRRLRVSPKAASIPHTTIDDIIDNPARCITMPGTGQMMPIPFINVKHHARLRVIDFYPHEICNFTELRAVDPSRPDETHWVWNFILRLAAPDARANTDGPTLDVEVSGDDATELLGIEPGDLQQEGLRLRVRNHLDELWGDLGSIKDQGWAHSGAKAATWREPLEVWDNAAIIDLVIAEFGVRKQGFEDLPAHRSGEEIDEAKQAELMQKRLADPDSGWLRIWKLTDTRLPHDDDSDDE